MEEIIDTFNLSENLPAWSLCYRFVESRSPRVSLMLTLPNQDKTNNVIDLYKDILRAVEDLTTCSYTSEAFSELLDKIQGAVSNSMLLLLHYGSDGGIIILGRLIDLTWKAMQTWIIGWQNWTSASKEFSYND